MKDHRPKFIILAITGIVMAINCPAVTAQQENKVALEKELQVAIKVINDVQPGGVGHQDAIKALEILNKAEAKHIPQILQGMDGANKLALNWLRGGIQSALDRDPIPREQIQAYLNDKTQSHMGRLMAFELLSEGDEQYASTTIPKMIDDPSLPLRQMAVADFIEKAKAADRAEAIGLLGYALSSAREVEQVDSIVKLLGEHDVQVDLQKQLGFLADWHVVGPFDNAEEKGFDKAFGPEANPAEVDLTTKYADSKTGDEIAWKAFNSLDPNGVVNLNDLLTEEKGVLAYAYTEFDAEEDQEVEIRIGCINGNKVWVNGEEILNNEIYHVGMMPDQFVGKVKLKEGVNTILFKVCQNEQTDPWANRWMFQLRVCMADGKAVLPAKPAPQQQ